MSWSDWKRYNGCKLATIRNKNVVFSRFSSSLWGDLPSQRECSFCNGIAGQGWCMWLCFAEAEQSSSPFLQWNWICGFTLHVWAVYECGNSQPHIWVSSPSHLVPLAQTVNGGIMSYISVLEDWWDSMVSFRNWSIQSRYGQICPINMSEGTNVGLNRILSNSCENWSGLGVSSLHLYLRKQKKMDHTGELAEMSHVDRCFSSRSSI